LMKKMEARSLAELVVMAYASGEGRLVMKAAGAKT